MEVDIHESLNGASQGLDADDVQVDDVELAEEQHSSSISQDNWDAKETDVLVVAKLEMDDIIEHGGLAVKMRTKKRHWEDIAQICVRSNVHRTGKQCMNRWNRVFREWKIIYDYERHIPSGHGSYWQLNVRERRAKKLPTSFSNDMFLVIEIIELWALSFVAHANAVSAHATMEEQGDNPQASPPPAPSEGASTEKERTRGHKRKHPVRSRVGKDLEEVNRQLVDWFEQSDDKRIAWEKEVVENNRQQFEANLELQRSRLELERQRGEERRENDRGSNMALFEIASSIKSLANVLKEDRQKFAVDEKVLLGSKLIVVSYMMFIEDA
ncbi:hypothetical protein L7F22_034998 [Adiantum nelumboides]|nr:hypothetical protein [Adiantum nelumboides]